MASRNPTDPDFSRAFAEVTTRPEPIVLTVEKLVDDFLNSAVMPKGDRSRDDIRKWTRRFQAEFRLDPIAMFEERASRGEVNLWRAKWIHSAKQHDVAGTHAVRVLNWAVSEGRLKEHHCHKQDKLYKADRSEIIWTTKDRENFAKVAPTWVVRILETGCEAGLRPADLVCLDLDEHVNVTRAGRRLKVLTVKRKQVAYIPVSQRLAQIIDQTPQGQQFLLVDGKGGRVSKGRASNEITFRRREAGVSRSADGREKALNDTRGTAATKFLNAGGRLAKIANYMGWSVRYASNVIEHYATVLPSESDEVLRKLSAALEREDALEL